MAISDKLKILESYFTDRDLFQEVDEKTIEDQVEMTEILFESPEKILSLWVSN